MECEKSVVCGRGEVMSGVRGVWCVGGVRVMSGRGGWGQLNFTNQNGHTN